MSRGDNHNLGGSNRDIVLRVSKSQIDQNFNDSTVTLGDNDQNGKFTMGPGSETKIHQDRQNHLGFDQSLINELNDNMKNAMKALGFDESEYSIKDK